MKLKDMISTLRTAQFEPKCEHFYTEWTYFPKPIECAGLLMFKCDKCGEVITLNCSERMIRDVFGRGV